MSERSIFTFMRMKYVGVITITAATVMLAIAGCKQNKQPMDQNVATKGVTPPAPELTPPATAEPQNLDDEEMVQAVEREILFDSAVEMANINVNATNGIVELTGTVDNLLAQERATRIAQAVKGVRAVSNRIEVKPSEARSGDEIRRDAENALLWDPATDSYEVKVAVEANTVTLKGTVQSWAEKQLAERVVKGVKGVVKVDNQIDINYAAKRSDVEIKRDIEQRLRWDILVDGALIDVTVNEGKVDMSGVVGSTAEKARAYQDAWVMGVMSVDHDDVEVQWWAKDEDLRSTKYMVKSDEEIAQAIKDAAMFDPRVYSFRITPEVSGGVVTLRGTVDNLRAKRAAEALAENTVGVVGVRNLLDVRAQKNIPDKDIVQRVRAALVVNPITDSYEIKVDVDKGKATLSGKVDTYFEKAEAENVAMGVVGVNEVANELAVSNVGTAYVFDPYVYPYHPLTFAPTFMPPAPAKSDAEILQDIKDEMFWSPFVDSTEIEVAVNSGTATLTGTVDTWRERAAATENAFEGGAIVVNNQLTVR